MTKGDASVISISAVGNFLEYLTYLIFGASAYLIDFFDIHSNGVIAIAATFTSAASFYFKSKAFLMYSKNNSKDDFDDKSEELDSMMIKNKYWKNKKIKK